MARTNKQYHISEIKSMLFKWKAKVYESLLNRFSLSPSDKLLESLICTHIVSVCVCSCFVLVFALSSWLLLGCFVFEKKKVTEQELIEKKVCRI